MTDVDGDEGWFRHVRDRVERLPPAYFREFTVDIWGLRGFDVAGGYEGDGADFVALRDTAGEAEVEAVAVAENGTVEDARELTQAAEELDGATPVVVAKRFDDTDAVHAEGVEAVDAERVARLVVDGGFYWTFYRWVALSEAEEPDVVAETTAPVRYGDGGGVGVGRATASRIGAGEGDVVRVAREASGKARLGGRLERERNYVEVAEGYEEGVGADKGDEVNVELLGTGEARRVYVLSVPSMDDELAAEVWEGHAPHAGTELSQPYGDGEVRTMALEVLPRDHSYVDEATDVVVEGYAGARRVFE